MQRNINEESQKKRIREATKGAVLSSIFIILSALGMLFIKHHFGISGFWGSVLSISATIDILVLPYIYKLLKLRIEEIKGGEEDAASEY